MDLKEIGSVWMGFTWFGIEIHSYGCGTVIRCAVFDILKDQSTFPSILYKVNLHKCQTLVNHFDNRHPNVLLITIQYKFRFSLNLSPHMLRTHKM